MIRPRRPATASLPCAALALLAAIAVAGCGDASLSAAQLQSQAAHICSLAARQTARIPMPTAPSGAPAFVSRGIGTIDRELIDLRSLHGTGTFGRAVDETADELSAFRSTLRGLQAGNDPVAAIKTLQHRLGPLERRVDDAWRKLGIPACVSR